MHTPLPWSPSPLAAQGAPSVGDKLLIEIAQRIRLNVRAADTVARLGGDEFVVMLEDLSLNAQDAAIQAGLVAEKVREALAAPWETEDREFNGSASIGIASGLSVAGSKTSPQAADAVTEPGEPLSEEEEAPAPHTPGVAGEPWAAGGGGAAAATDSEDPS